MIRITNPADCCGCSACASICNQNAITMTPDALGFLYPEIDSDKCTNCGLCDNVCSFNDDYDTSMNLAEPIAYGARHKDIEEVMRSRSGAVFVAISDYILDRGGVVYGAGYADHFRVIHKRATTKEERDEFRGSKYVQSDMNTVFKEVKRDLKDGLIVLFSGTPCQTSGLNSFVGKNLRKNLILVDIVCHGVPSPAIWDDYISLIESKSKSTVIDVDFRNKKQYGWEDHKETYRLANSPSVWQQYTINSQGKWKTWYTKTFYDHIMFRHSCGNCHYCNTQRPSDITIADFWGWQKQDSNINSDNKGLNLVLINTPIGQNLFDAISDKLEVIDASPDAYMQPNLRTPSRIHGKRLKFESDYMKKGFAYIFEHRYDERPLWKQLASKMYVPLIKFLKK